MMSKNNRNTSKSPFSANLAMVAISFFFGPAAFAGNGTFGTLAVSVVREKPAFALTLLEYEAEHLLPNGRVKTAAEFCQRLEGIFIPEVISEVCASPDALGEYRMQSPNEGLFTADPEKLDSLMARVTRFSKNNLPGHRPVGTHYQARFSELSLRILALANAIEVRRELSFGGANTGISDEIRQEIRKGAGLPQLRSFLVNRLLLPLKDCSTETSETCGES